MRTLGLLALCLAIALGSIWLFVDSSEGADALEARRPQDEPLAAPSTVLPVVPDARPEPPRTGERQPLTVEPAPAATSGEDAFLFAGTLVLPDGARVHVPQARAELRGEGGAPRLFDRQEVDVIAIGGVTRQRYELRVEVPGYRHRPQTFDFSETEASHQPLAPTFAERVILWPAGWIAVVVVTPQEKPFRTLAEELGFEPKNLFVNAFDVRVSRVLAASGDPLPPLDPGLATWHPAPGFQNVELPGSVAGSLELHAAPPLWVGLWVHDRVHEGRWLNADDEELIFLLDPAALEAGLASVTLKLVDRESRAPVLEASATLKADTSAHRRRDLNRRAPDPNGMLVFRRVVPGQHELAIERGGGQIVQRRLLLAPGQELDLGEVEIGSGPGLRVRVVDRQGEALPAWIEIGPYERGARADELYPPNLHRKTADDGFYDAPVPDRLSILRARPERLHGGPRGHPSVGSRNYLLDPQALPAELVVQAEEALALRVEPRTPWVAGQRVTFEDELGLIVHSAGGSRLDAVLVPGAYTARRWDGETELGALAVVVSSDSRAVACP